jgi:hypothetical protein
LHCRGCGSDKKPFNGWRCKECCGEEFEEPVGWQEGPLSWCRKRGRRKGRRRKGGWRKGKEKDEEEASMGDELTGYESIWLESGPTEEEHFWDWNPPLFGPLPN